jgi:hypothetical protein
VAALVVVAGAAAAACGDGGTDGLMGGAATMGGVAHGNGLGVVLVDGGRDGAPTGDANPEQNAAEAAFLALRSDLARACGGTCHEQGAGNAPAWMGPPDAYKAIKTYSGIVVRDVATSKMLVKGRHEGPDLVDPLRTQVQSWLDLEAQAIADTTLPTTPLFSVSPGANAVDISMAGTNVAGVKLTFSAAVDADILTLSNMKVVAPATTGVHVVFPIFVVSPLSGTETSDTSFSNADQTFVAGQATALQPGMLILTGWNATDRMRIEFTKLEGATVVGVDGGGGVTGGGGCKSVSSFTANAVPAIQANGCLNCHNTGGPGNGSLDLSSLAATPPDDGAACNQALLRVNTQTPAQSDIILAPTGGVANHPFKNADATYAQMMEAWIANEK